ncbi:thioredoxin family protein [Magnetococcus sp. PR-3]|uniref:thioredoxin family protein n=1 Tax=Magnetococcus sp. PR-3 TaxID=3120355 RepID=UPI002FCE3B83
MSTCSAVLDITEEQFDHNVVEATGVVLVKFWAPWCGNSRKMTPVYEQVAQQLSGVVSLRLDIDHNPTIPRRYGVRGVPIFMLFRHGQIVDTRTGVIEESDFLAWINRLINS